MTLSLGPFDFDRVDFDVKGDVLYASVKGARPAAYVTETREGHTISFDPAGRVVGLTILNAKWLLDREGEITLTQVFKAEQIAPALAAEAR
jgi:uncharacterized protein YuzE